ncbi:MAG: hypothetical protein ACRC3J_09245 [Culicoidibacterales bacterium]
MSGKATTNKAAYTRYENSNHYAKNKRKRVAAHVARHPNDEQAADVMKVVANATKPTRAGYRGPKNGPKLSSATKQLQQITRMMKQLKKAAEKAPKGKFMLGKEGKFYTVEQLKSELGLDLYVPAPVAKRKPKPKSGK